VILSHGLLALTLQLLSKKRLGVGILREWFSSRRLLMLGILILDSGFLDGLDFRRLREGASPDTTSAQINGLVSLIA
jgi:hypothetical protein